MATKIRLARGGAKKSPFYRIVVADSRNPRDGRFIEKVGTYNPRLAQDHPDRLVIQGDRVRHWLGVGAQATERVQFLLSRLDMMPPPPRREQPKKAAPKAKAQERAKQRAAKEEAARAAAAAAAEAGGD